MGGIDPCDTSGILLLLLLLTVDSCSMSSCTLPALSPEYEEGTDEEELLPLLLTSDLPFLAPLSAMR